MPCGQLDIDTGSVLRDALDRALRRPGPRVVVDLSRLDFCDSTGLSAFVMAHTYAGEHGGWFRLAAPTPFLERVLRTVGLATVLPVYPSVSDAVQPSVHP